MWELVTSEPNPLVGMVGDKYVEALASGLRPKLPEVHPDYETLVEQCWQFDLKQRPTALQVVEKLEIILEELLH